MADKRFAGIVLVALLTVVYAQLAYGYWVGSGGGEELCLSCLPMDDEDSPRSSRRNGPGNTNPTRASRTQAPNRDSDNQKDSRSEEQSSEASAFSHPNIPGGTGDSEKESDESSSGSGSGSDYGETSYDEEDLPCERMGGGCEDISTPCDGEYRPGYCGGPRSRQCCVYIDYRVEDLPCENVGGACQDISERCSGEYLTGKCGGPRSRKCCVEKGSWSKWTRWAQCSRSCGDGKQSRTRSCKGPGKCVGRSKMTQRCNIRVCPGSWSKWTKWSKCSRSCGGGKQSRTRSCKGPGKCVGRSKMTQRCNTRVCPETSYDEADLPCERMGGSCQDISTPCDGVYRPGNCGGPRSRQCCVYIDYRVEDLPCENIGGACQDISETCSGEYRPGYCGGPRSRQCCVYIDYRDLPCENIGGACQYISETCSGEYRPGYCGGPRKRQCCVTDGEISGSGEETNEPPIDDEDTPGIGTRDESESVKNTRKVNNNSSATESGNDDETPPVDVNDPDDGDTPDNGTRDESESVNNTRKVNNNSATESENVDETPPVDVNGPDDGDTPDNGTLDESESVNNTRKVNNSSATESENVDETPPVDVNGPETATFGAEKDLPCENIGGTCQDVSEPCDGVYISRKCGGPRTRMCCVQKKTPEMKDNSDPCALVTYSSPYITGYRGSNVRVHQGFVSSMDKISRAASACRVTVRVTHSFRKSGQRLRDVRAPPAKRSNHLVGHAIDFNLITPDGWCNSTCLQAKSHQGVQCFLDRVKAAGLRWGGDIDPRDPVHIDDELNYKNVPLWNQLYVALQENSD